MITITEEYCNSHGLKFSTDKDPRKSKTKCISWMRARRPLPKLQLCGHSLPWVDRILHLGNCLTEDVHIVHDDMNIKKARYIAKTIEINQEFYFSAAETRLKINDIYNSSWFGSVVWNLFCPASVKVESSYNRSLKVMMKLPVETHRELIEPLSGRQHVKLLLIRRFLQMIRKMKTSNKPILRTLLATVEDDTKSTTGRNMRCIMLLTERSSIQEVEVEDIEKLVYHKVKEERQWRVELVELLLLAREEEAGRLSPGTVRVALH